MNFLSQSQRQSAGQRCTWRKDFGCYIGYLTDQSQQIINKIVGTNFQQTAVIFGTKSIPKRVFSIKSRTNERYHQAQHIPLNLGTQFCLKQTISVFWIKFC